MRALFLTGEHASTPHFSALTVCALSPFSTHESELYSKVLCHIQDDQGLLDSQRSWQSNDLMKDSRTKHSERLPSVKIVRLTRFIMPTRRRLRGRRFAVFICTGEQSFRGIKALPAPSGVTELVSVPLSTLCVTVLWQGNPDPYLSERHESLSISAICPLIPMSRISATHVLSLTLSWTFLNVLWRKLEYCPHLLIVC